jgi:hypothetical protein
MIAATGAFSSEWLTRRGGEPKQDARPLAEVVGFAQALSVALGV